MNENAQSTINQRINFLIESQNLSIRKFAMDIEFTDTTIHRIVKNEAKPGYEVISAILNHHPTLSADWLIKGEGEMYRDASENSTPAVEQLVKELDRKEEQIKWLQKAFTDVMNLVQNKGNLAKLNAVGVARSEIGYSFGYTNPAA